MYNQLEKQRLEIEKKLSDLRAEREAYFKTQIDNLIISNDVAMKKLQAENETRIKTLNNDYANKLAIVEKQKADLNKQYEDFKITTQTNMDNLKKQYSDMVSMYNQQVASLNKALADKNIQIQTDLKILEERFKLEAETLSEQSNTKKLSIINQTNLQIEKYIDKYNNQKVVIDESFEQQKIQKQKEFEKELENQKKYYLSQLDTIKLTNEKINSEVIGMVDKYNSTLTKNQQEYNNMVQSYSIKKDLFLKDYENKKIEAETKFVTTIKELEDKRMQIIKKTQEDTAYEIKKLNDSVANIRIEVEAETKIYKVGLINLINKLEDEKKSIIQNKTDATNKEILFLSQSVNQARIETEKKAEIYKKQLTDLINNLENEKIKARIINQEEIQKDLLNINKTITTARIQSEQEADKYRQDLKDLINKLEDERKTIIKSNVDATNNEILKLTQNVNSAKQITEEQAIIYKKQLTDLITNLENEKIRARIISQEETEREITNINKTVSTVRIQSEQEANKYRKELADLINKIEDEKLILIKNAQDSTSNQISLLNKTVEDIKVETEHQAEIYRTQLVQLITDLENDKIKIQKIKQEETLNEIENLNKTIETIYDEFDAKSSLYKKELADLIDRIEEEKRNIIIKSKAESQLEIDGVAYTVTKAREELEASSEIKKKQLMDLIIELEDSKIKRVKEYTDIINDRIKSLNEIYAQQEQKLLDKIEILKKTQFVSEVKNDGDTYYKNAFIIVSVLLVITLIYTMINRN